MYHRTQPQQSRFLAGITTVLHSPVGSRTLATRQVVTVSRIDTDHPVWQMYRIELFEPTQVVVGRYALPGLMASSMNNPTQTLTQEDDR